MTQSGGNNNVFPAFSGFLVQSLGIQGIPGSCPSAIAATSIDYGRSTDCIPASVTSVDAALAWFETNVACVLDPASILAAPDGYILVWDTTEMKLVPRTIGSALGSGLPGNSNNDVLLFNTLSGSYTPTSLATWLMTTLPGVLPDAFNAVFPCNTPGQILSCTATGWAATSFLQSFNTGISGNDNFDVLFWNAGTGSWQVTDAGSVIGNNLPAALAAAFPCTTGDLITCVGGQWQSTTFQAAMTSGLPGTTASDILVWNGAQWVPQEEQTWLTTVLGPALGNQSFTALGDTPATFGSPGQVFTTNAAGTGGIWTTPDATVTTFVGLTDTPAALTPNTFLQVNATGTGFDSVNVCTAIATCQLSSFQDVPAIGGPLQILRVNALGGAHEYADICTAIAGCSITNLQDGPNALGTSLQVLRMNLAGSDLEFADICTAIATCSITNLADGPGALGTPNQILKMNPAGTDLIFADFCTELGNCSITALSDTPTVLGNPGEVLTVGPAGTATIWSAAAAGGVLPAGVAGDMVTYDAAGTDGVARTLTEYLDLYYPPPANLCNAQLTNSGAGWVVAEGIPAPPPVWTFPLAPQSVGLELEANPNTMCAEWVAPSHVSGTFAVPGDFPSVADFLTWSSGRSVDVTLDLAAAQPGITIPNSPAPTGQITVNANGQSVGEVSTENSAIDLTIQNAVHDSILADHGSKLVIENPASIANTSGRGVEVANASYLLVTGIADITGVGDIGLLTRSGGNLQVDGGLVVNGANATANVFADSGSSMVINGDLQASNSGGVGVRVRAGSSVAVNGDVFATNNAGFGVVANINASVRCIGITADANGASGVNLGISGALNATGQTFFRGNGINGLEALSGSTAVLGGDTLSENNGNSGYLAERNGLIEMSPGINTTSQNNTIGSFAGTNGTVDFRTAAVTINGNNLGLQVTRGGQMSSTGGPITFAGNTTDTNIPVNAPSPFGDGAYIRDI